jgi:hypothetical protein
VPRPVPAEPVARAPVDDRAPRRAGAEPAELDPAEGELCAEVPELEGCVCAGVHVEDEPPGEDEPPAEDERSGGEERPGEDERSGGEEAEGGGPPPEGAPTGGVETGGPGTLGRPGC